jgi:hypothetical protein
MPGDGGAVGPDATTMSGISIASVLGYFTSETVATGPNTAMGGGLAAQVAAWVPAGADSGLTGDAADSEGVGGAVDAAVDAVREAGGAD